MEITQKQRTKIAQKQRTHAHIQDYCAEYLYATHLSEQQYHNLMFIHDEPSHVLSRTYFIRDKRYIVPDNAVMWSKTQKHGWSNSTRTAKKHNQGK